MNKEFQRALEEVQMHLAQAKDLAKKGMYTSAQVEVDKASDLIHGMVKKQAEEKGKE